MKKLLIFLLAAMMIVCSCACGKGDNKNTEKNGKKPRKTSTSVSSITKQSETLAVSSAEGSITASSTSKEGKPTSATSFVSDAEKTTASHKPTATTNDKAPVANSVLSISDAIALGLSKNNNEFTTSRYYVIGIVSEMLDSPWGSMTIQDVQGNVLHILSAYSADGSAALSTLSVQPKVGDRVKLYGFIGRKDDTAHDACMYQAWLIEVNDKKPIATSAKPTNSTNQPTASTQTPTQSTTTPTACQHVYASKVLKDPTCTDYGLTKRTCEKCGFEYTENTMPIDHKFSGSCGSKCATCDLHLLHKWNAGVVNKQPTCDQMGGIVYTCTVCGEEHHDMSAHNAGNTNPVDIRKEPCVESGEAHYLCQDCGELFLKDMFPIGYHVDYNGDNQCDGCGEHIDE